jgi:hypothetical protein
VCAEGGLDEQFKDAGRSVAGVGIAHPIPRMWLDRPSMTLEEALRQTNRNMVVFDIALGTGALLAPRRTAQVMFGHDDPSEDSLYWLQRSGPVWLTFAAAHLIAMRRGEPRDWWALAWLRGTEVATDALLARSPAISRPTARAGLVLAGVANLAMALGFARLARR